MPRTIRLVSRSLRNHGATNPQTIARAERARYTEEHARGDWFPGDAADPVPLPANGERE